MEPGKAKKKEKTFLTVCNIVIFLMQFTFYLPLSGHSRGAFQSGVNYKKRYNMHAMTHQRKMSYTHFLLIFSKLNRMQRRRQPVDLTKNEDRI